MEVGGVFDGAGCRRIAGAILPDSALRIPARSGPLLPDLRGAERKARWGRGDRAHPNSRPHGTPDRNPDCPPHLAPAARRGDSHQAAHFCRTHPSPHGSPNSHAEADPHSSANDAPRGGRTHFSAHGSPNSDTKADSHLCSNDATRGDRTDVSTHGRPDPAPNHPTYSVAETHACFNRAAGGGRTHGRADAASSDTRSLPDGNSDGNSSSSNATNPSGGADNAAPDRNCQHSLAHRRADSDCSSGDATGDTGPRRTGGCRHAAPRSRVAYSHPSTGNHSHPGSLRFADSVPSTRKHLPRQSPACFVGSARGFRALARNRRLPPARIRRACPIPSGLSGASGRQRS